ncbi:ATP-grasp peptide maturase system methyltransferase [Kitasatospora sp. NBC_01287]|uniref:ATP-grasp peptide maturase system methyltransferase n=1 Tax=Kitasatospora sp. NBC_01287 TaxID=2903573 RepID=UPI00224FFF68|nr:ATP-grasp peptide maturase system methyltransferase [Kitasatospora sp. NBC_01287]MCX4747257.1 ATP-grasp peptide maturase system methyltransferase [Kitasatospora sp. NBC_01287]
MTDAERLRANLVDTLTAEGVLPDPAWRKAAEAVPRELFVASHFTEVAGSNPTSYRVTHPDAPGWLEAVYTNQTLITQLDGRADPSDAGDQPVTGAPSSSSTLPSLVLGMWQQLDVEVGQRVLEIGTGTGYSTALGAHRLGSENVVSIEVDPGVADRAKRAVTAAGYAPTLVVGDGLNGHADGAPYDRLIATCSVRHVPMPWLYQVNPGGRILVTLTGWSFRFGLALLTVTGPGRATGRFLPGYTSFMVARPHDRPPRQSLWLMPGEERPTRIDPALIGDWTGGWVAQLAAPSAEQLGMGGQQILSDVATGSQARTALSPDGGWTVIQRGPLRLWDQVESAIEAWQAAGSPHQEGFGITVTENGQRVWIGDEDGPGWDLPV